MSTSHSRICRRLLAIALSLFVLALSPRARADVVIIVNSANHESIDTAGLSKIFMAQNYTFPSGGSAQPVYQTVGSRVDEEFTGKLVKSMPVDVKRVWAGLQFTGGARRPRVFGSDDDVIKFVAGNPQAIGYVNADKVHGDDVRVVMKL
jgi:ABC-type phosphate transport system substrate-binding protein